MDKTMTGVEMRLENGDIVLLQAGDLVPADLKLLEARGLEVDEWELTGALAPVKKQANGQQDAYLYRGSRVIRGSGKGIVVATGRETEYGKILNQRQKQEKQRFPPVIRGKYSILLAILLPSFIAALRRYNNDALTFLLYLIAAFAIVLLQNDELFRYFLTSVEARKLKNRRILIRDTASLDVMSNLDVVCLDKTGVLTTRELEVGGIHFADEMLDPVAFSPDDKLGTLTTLACALCNDIFFLERKGQANPIDRALISFASRHGFEFDDLVMSYRRSYDKPFDSEDRHMIAGFEIGDQPLYFAKGDPKVILKICTGYMTAPGTIERVSGPFLQRIRTAADSINRQGDIVIALAYSPGTAPTPPRHYMFLCLIQLRNPLRPEVPDIVGRLKEMGIRPVMLTGDGPEVAMSIGKQAGISPDSGYCLTGRQIARMSSQEVARQALDVSIFARLLPSQKGLLVRLFQQNGCSVAMIGDGANDAIALRTADTGLSFVESSSPLARRSSSGIINDLADLLAIIQQAQRIKQRTICLKLARVATLILIPFSLYAWALS